jgi:Glycosyl transferase family 2
LKHENQNGHDNMKSDIGVAIATYNGIKYLGAQLDSICRQTHPPSVISISDDCSTDGTIVFTPMPHRGGVIDNFLNAFDHCKSAHIAYCDQDDVWREDRLALCSAALHDPAVALVLHPSAIVDENLHPTGRAEPSNIRAGTYSQPHFPDFLWGFGHQMVFSRRVLEVMREIVKCESNAIAPVSANFDRALLTAAGMVGQIRFIDEALVQFRRHGQSTSAAGKAGVPQAGEAQADERRERVEATKSLIDGLLAELEADRLAVAGDTTAKRAYVRHLRGLAQRYEARRQVYALPSRARRVGALLGLIAGNSYGALTANKLPPRHLLLDAWRSVKGGGAG